MYWRFTVLLICFFVFAFLAKGQDTPFITTKTYTVYQGDTINRRKNGKKEGRWVYFHIDTINGSIHTISTDDYWGKNGKPHSERKSRDSSWFYLSITPILSGYYIKDLKAGDWVLSSDSFKTIDMCATFNNDRLDNDLWGLGMNGEFIIRMFKTAGGLALEDMRDRKIFYRPLYFLDFLFGCDLSKVNFPEVIDLQDILKSLPPQPPPQISTNINK